MQGIQILIFFLSSFASNFIISVLGSFKFCDLAPVMYVMKQAINIAEVLKETLILTRELMQYKI